MIREERLRGRGTAGLAEADPDPGDEELDEVPGEAAGRRHRAPDGEGDGDEAAPAPAIGEAREWKPGERIADREREPDEQPRLGIREQQILLHLR